MALRDEALSTAEHASARELFTGVEVRDEVAERIGHRQGRVSGTGDAQHPGKLNIRTPRVKGRGAAHPKVPCRPPLPRSEPQVPPLVASQIRLPANRPSARAITDPAEGTLLLLPAGERCILGITMRVVGRKRLDLFARQHPPVRPLAKAWLEEVTAANWTVTQDIKNHYSTASFLAGNRVVFNLGGNKYRLLVTVAFRNGVVVIERVGTHAEYDRWKI
jgi:mRNA interferase HigB